MESVSKSSTSSRLDRVFTLLENGTSPITRKAAAKQLGDVQKKYPHELNNLLAKLLVYIKHTEWSTRIAAAEAIEAVISHVDSWNPEHAVKQEAESSEFPDNKLKLSQFDVDRVLGGSALLLGSSGDEYKTKSGESHAKDRIRKQRLLLEQRLGLTLGGTTSVGVSSNDLFKDEDLIENHASEAKATAVKTEPCSSVMSQITAGMSSREKNKAKRKARSLMKQQSREQRHKQQEADNKDSQPSKKRKLCKEGDKSSACVTSQSALLENVPEHKPDPNDWKEWPFEWICEELVNMLFSAAWEARHGACLALREILKRQGGGCGKVGGMTTPQLDKSHQMWLCDAAVRLLCVIALDRFADYVSDQVTAPVRESCAQTLSVVVKFMSEEYVFSTISILMRLYAQKEWEVRQSALLTLQYIVAVRQDLQSKLLAFCFPTLVSGLQDTDGDVRSVSAKALMPLTQLLVKEQNAQNLDLLLRILWDSLKTYDELTASTQSVLLLLSKILTSLPAEKIRNIDRPEVLAHRLLSFFHHASASVRQAALSTLDTMISSDPAQDVIPWLSHICVDSLWNLFQSCLLEAKASVRQSASKLFVLFSRKSSASSLLQLIPHIPLWMSLSCQPEALPIDGSLLVQTKSISSCEDPSSVSQKLIGGTRSALAPSSAGVTYAEHVTETREIATRMISVLCCHAFGGNSPETLPAVSLVTDHFTQLMTSQSALHRMAVGMVIGGWWEEISSRDSLVFPASLSSHLHSLLINAHTESLYFSEITLKFIQVQTDVKALISALAQRGIPLLHDFPVKSSYNFQEVLDLCSNNFPSHLLNNDDELMHQRNHLIKLTNETMTTQSSLDCRVKFYISSALVCAATSRTDDVPWRMAQKLNPVIRPLMDSAKSEQNQTIRSSVARTIAQLLGLCASRQPCPNTKLVRNLCTSLTNHTSRCPTVDSIKAEFSDEVLQSCKVARDALYRDAIITLLRQQATTASDIISKKRKRPTEEGNTQDEIKQANNATASKGAVCCLKTICKMHGGTLFHVVPNLWDKICAFKELAKKLNTEEPGSDDAVAVISQSLSTFEVVVPVITDPTLKDQILTLLPSLVELLWSDPSNVRYLASRSLAVLARHAPQNVMPLFVEQVTDNFDDTDQVVRRKGAVEAVAALIDELGVEVVPYSVLLVVPLLGRMSDHDPQVRMLATHCFAQLIQFMPVESSIPDPLNMPESLMRRKSKERLFLEQLMDIRMLEDFHVPVHINATLRSYQQDGVKWLAFLNRFKLHGILCDDMGLGKTLQTICIVASDHHYKAKKIKESSKRRDLLSLVVCPPTLTGHWVEEVGKFCDDLIPLHYAGNPQERAKLQSSIGQHNLVVASYEVVRNDVNFFSRYKWNYCVLDEGHAIRNGKSKISQCVKSLISNHRLILTGTPIQNSVLELWSLFDFLIPGFLGSEAEFNSRFTKPILASRDAKNSSKEQEEGLIALEALHRQVLPFMLRRMKEDVLKDLPPKIIQDYYCDLSPLQLQLYEDFAKSQAKKDAESTITKIDAEGDQRSLNKDASHVFQALQYLQKVCNHPLFVLSPSHPRYQRFMTQLKSSGSSLREIKHAAKLPSLRQLLLDCGIGVLADSGAEVSVLGQHRALIFCQHRNMLDIIQNDLFGALMPSVTFLRLDGAVPANQRFAIVSRFNNDPSIDVLLLTTKVGGLGLNLTGADTVVFVEHDWNPMVDLQAMDRAHRIGQKKVVNVYRLITRGTLEEKILGLQKFKLNIANTVVSDDNRGLQSMGTGQVLDLFNVDKDAEKKSKSSSSDAKSPSKGLRAMMDSLGELWDQNQYAEEYDINHFIQTLS